MAGSQDVGLQIEQDLLGKTEVILHYLRGLEATDRALADRIRAAIIARLDISRERDGAVGSIELDRPRLAPAPAGPRGFAGRGR